MCTVMEKSGLLEAQLRMRDEWRFARMNSGEQSVTALGMTMLHPLYVDSLGTLYKVSSYQVYS